MRRLLTAREAAEVLSISMRNFRRRTYQGEIRTVRIGRRTLFDPKSLAQFVRDHEQGKESKVA